MQWMLPLVRRRRFVTRAQAAGQGDWVADSAWAIVMQVT
jgi:hypothetical protein